MAIDGEAQETTNEKLLLSYENSGELLVRELRPALLRRALRRGLAFFAAEEVVQEAFLALFAKRPRLRNVAAWLNCVLDRRVVDRRRREALRRLWEQPGTEATAARAATLPSLDDHLAVHEAMARLPRRQRELVRRRYLAEEVASAAAEAAGYRPASAKKLLSRALGRLRSTLAETDPSSSRRR